MDTSDTTQNTLENTPENSNRTLFDRIFRDRNGNIVIAQFPNLPILVWLVATILQRLTPNGNINRGLEAIAFGSLFTWAWLELFQGVNYFRRSLGFVVLTIIIVSKFRS